MQTRNLGKSNLEVSALGLGCTGKTDSYERYTAPLLSKYVRTVLSSEQLLGLSIAIAQAQEFGETV